MKKIKKTLIKNKSKIIFGSLILVILILGGFIISKELKIQELNRGACDWMDCLLQCEVKIGSVSGWQIDSSCAKDCDGNLEVSVSQKFLERNMNNLLVGSDEFEKCKASSDFKDYYNCLKEFYAGNC